MAYSHTNRAVLIAVLMAVGLMSMALNPALACEQPNFGQLYTKCGSYVGSSASDKAKPLDACCSLLKKTNIQCACKYVTADMEKLVDPKKALHVAKECGITVKPGTKCGSYTVPGA